MSARVSRYFGDTSSEEDDEDYLSKIVEMISGDLARASVSHEWYFQDDDGSWVKYGAKVFAGRTLTTDEVEDHYAENPTKSLRFTLNTHSYKIDFNQMVQKNKTTGKVRAVCRVIAGAPPPTRAQVKGKQTVQNASGRSISSNSNTYTVESLNPAHPEYSVCRDRMGDLKSRVPKQVFKVNSPYQETDFNNRKSCLQQQNPGVTYREYCLFHGTKTENVESILRDNIDWRLHGSRVGQKYGQGTYFSKSAIFSLDYGPVLLLCRVLVGLTAVGNAHMQRPPVDRHNRLSDTSVNDVSNPSIFVKYDSREYYPLYYVQF